MHTNMLELTHRGNWSLLKMLTKIDDREKVSQRRKVQDLIDSLLNSIRLLKKN
jgi:hypothetical protein